MSIPKLRCLAQCFHPHPVRWLSYCMPMLLFHDNWSKNPQPSKLTTADVQKLMSSEPYYFIMDELYKPMKNLEELEADTDMPEQAAALIDEILALCKSHDTEVILFTVFEETGLNTEKDFRSREHLNAYGAEKIAMYPGKYISEHYRLTDWRQVEGKLWEDRMIDQEAERAYIESAGTLEDNVEGD